MDMNARVEEKYVETSTNTQNLTLDACSLSPVSWTRFDVPTTMSKVGLGIPFIYNKLIIIKQHIDL